MIKRIIICLGFMIFTMRANADLCGMFGQHDVLCQSEQLREQLQPEAMLEELDRQNNKNFNVLVSRCYSGDQAARNGLEAMTNTPVFKEPYMHDWADSFSYGGE